MTPNAMLIKKITKLMKNLQNVLGLYCDQTMQ